MSSPLQREHAEEGTHIVCDERLEKEGGKATCCVCNPHENCELSSPTPKTKPSRKQ